MNIETVIEALGGTAATARVVGVVPSAVSNAKSAGKFPAAWRMPIFLHLRKIGRTEDAERFAGSEEAA